MSRRPIRIALVLCLALSGLLYGCSAGNDSGPTAESPQAQTVDSLIARLLEARGGAERLEAIETLFMSGRAITRPGQEALVTREVRPPGRIRTEFYHQGVTSIFACDGSKCWYVDPMGGVFEAELMSPIDAALAIQQADIQGIIDWKAKGYSVELLGTETIDGREAYALKVTSSAGAVFTSYLDAETALVVRRESTRTFRGRTIGVETTFSDFRSVGGVVFSHSIRSQAEGQLESLEVVVEKIEINPPIDDARFEMPEAGPVD